MSATVAERFRTWAATQSPGELTQPSGRGIARPDPPATGRGVRPPSRPPAAFSPFVTVRGLREVRACTAEPPAAALRLTERGMAVIMVVALMLFVSAVVVIGLTVVRVTGPDYVPYGQTSGVDR